MKFTTLLTLIAMMLMSFSCVGEVEYEAHGIAPERPTEPVALPSPLTYELPMPPDVRIPRVDPFPLMLPIVYG